MCKNICAKAAMNDINWLQFFISNLWKWCGIMCQHISMTLAQVRILLGDWVSDLVKFI